MSRSLRFSVAVLGLLALAGANLTVAMSLDSGNPPPIRKGVSDLMANHGWTLATWQLFPWWLSENFESANVTHTGFSDSRQGIRLQNINPRFPTVTTDQEQVPLDAVSHAESLLAAIQPYTQTVPGQTIWCRAADFEDARLCEVVFAWEQNSESLPTQFVTVYLGSVSMAVIEESLLRSVLDELGLELGSDLTKSDR